MRVMLIGAYLANLVVAGALLWRQPARDGAAVIAPLTALDTLLLAAILLAPRLLRRCPPRWLSVPQADYWRRPANRPVAERRILARLQSFGAATFLFLLLSGFVVLHAQRTSGVTEEWQRLSITAQGGLAMPPEPERNEWEPVALRGIGVLFLFYSVAWYIGFLRDFQVPQNGK